jgi:hypothetical protein
MDAFLGVQVNPHFPLNTNQEKCLYNYKDFKMGNVLEFKASEKILLMQIKRQAIKDSKYLYQITAGFNCPMPIDPSSWEMFLAGVIEI